MMNNRPIMTPYPEYKATNLPWLPQIPAHWEVKKNKYLLKQREEVSQTGSELLLSLSQYTGITAKKISTGRLSETLVGYKIVNENDIVMNIMLAWNGSTAMSTLNGVVSPAYAVFRVVNNTNPKFLHYLFKTPQMLQYFKAYSSGVIESRLRLYPDELSKLFSIIPPAKEQEQIVHYLDSMTAKINKLIRAKKKQIALLQEQKQAIINQAVTKGLNPDAEMKDSSIDWLGQIPAHWEVKYLGHFSTLQNGISAPAEYFGSGYPFLNYGDVYNGYEISEPLSGLANSTTKEQERYSIQKGDVFFTRTSETIDEIAFSSVCMKSVPHAIFSGFLIRVRPRKEIISPLFSKYYFRCAALRNYFVKEMNLVTRASLSQQLLRALPVVLPTLEEQEEIAQFLEKKCQCFDKAIKIVENEIDFVAEYKNSLIASVVTGQVDVRNIPVEEFDPADLAPETDDDPAEEESTEENV